ncbi:MAG: glycosyltransferase [Thiolinea sp.]
MTTKIRLTQVMLASGNGGAETFFEKLAVAFQRAGIQQTLVIQPHAAREEKLRALGCDVRVIPSKGWRKHIARWQVARVVRETGSNIVLGWMSRGAAAVPHMRGVVKLARVGGYYKGKYFRRFDRVVVNAPQLIDYLAEAGVARDKLELIPNFADSLAMCDNSAAVVPELFGAGESHFVAASIGRLHKVKGHDVAIRLVARIPQLYLLIAGEGSERAALEALAVELGVAGRVRFLGWYREMGRVFAAADVILFPTRSEPFGNVVVEAWRERVPIISSDIEGPGWLIDHQINGLLCGKDNINEFEQALRQLMDSAELRGQLVAEGYKKLEQSFSTEAVVAAYRQLFADSLKEVSS